MIHAYAGSPFNEHQNERRDVKFLNRMLLDDHAKFLPVHNGSVLLSRGNDSLALAWRSRQHLEPEHPVVGENASTEAFLKGATTIFLGTSNDVPHFAVSVPEEKLFKDDAEASFTPLRSAFTLDRESVHIAGQASALSKWHDNTQFCSQCGQFTLSLDGGYSRQCSSSSAAAATSVSSSSEQKSEDTSSSSSSKRAKPKRCLKTHPRVDPVVIMAVHDNNGRLVLANNKTFPTGMHSVLAGFIGPGESVEEAVRREVREEVGLHVDEISYHSSQPWPLGPFSQLMIGCFARVSPEDAAKDPVVDPEELSSANWYSRSQILKALDEVTVEMNPNLTTFRLPTSISIAYQLIRSWADGDSLPSSSLLSNKKPSPESSTSGSGSDKSSL